MMKESRHKFQEKRHTDFLDLNDVLGLSAPELEPASSRPSKWPVAFVSGQKLIDFYGVRSHYNTYTHITHTYQYT